MFTPPGRLVLRKRSKVNPMAIEQTLALDVKRLSKGFGDASNRVTVLDGVDLELEHGVFDAVMGPSGSGKSTLLHLLAGLITADTGNIRIGGVAITSMSDNEVTCFRRRRIGLIDSRNVGDTLRREHHAAVDAEQRIVRVVGPTQTALHEFLPKVSERTVVSRREDASEDVRAQR